jgi:sec-independent protein translocase protein TatA
MNQIFLLIGTPGMPELLIILAIILLLFGSTRLPQLAKGLGKSIREFKKGANETGDAEESESLPRRESLRAESSRIEDERLPANEATVNKSR